MRSHRWSKYLPVVLVALAGCSAREGHAAVDTSGASGIPAVKAAPDSSPTPAAAPHTSDANIAALVDGANAGDSALAAQALPKLTASVAKSFARLMIGEHHALHVQSLQVERQQGITPQPPTPDPFEPAVEGEMNALRSLSPGAAYDSTYIAHEIGIHRAVIDWAGQPQNQPTNAAYRELLTRAGPVLQKHLDQALAAQNKLRRSVS